MRYWYKHFGQKISLNTVMKLEKPLNLSKVNFFQNAYQNQVESYFLEKL